jgi:hypothetical protein
MTHEMFWNELVGEFRPARRGWSNCLLDTAYK